MVREYSNEREKEIDYEWIKEEFFQIFGKEVVEEYCKKAIETYKKSIRKNNLFLIKNPKYQKENVEMAISFYGDVFENSIIFIY